MKFLLGICLLTFFIIFTNSIPPTFENEGANCEKKPQTFCGWNCNCDKNTRCQCNKNPGGSFGKCYTSAPHVEHASLNHCKRAGPDKNQSLICSYKCDPMKDSLIGETKLTCDESGKWDFKPPTCIDLGCQIVLNKKVINAKTQICNLTDENPSGLQCKVECNKGFIYQANYATLNCNIFRGVNAYPKCIDLACHVISYARVSNSKPPLCQLDKNTLEYACKLQCKDGFKYYGVYKADKILCMKNTQDKGLPMCVDKACQQIAEKKVKNAKTQSCSVVNNKKNMYEAICNVTCNDGYAYYGVHQAQKILCAGYTNGKPLPSCINKACKIIMDKKVENAKEQSCTMDKNSNGPTTCKFVCKEGFKYYGVSKQEKIVCTEKTDEKNLPSCIKPSTTAKPTTAAKPSSTAKPTSTVDPAECED